MSSEITPTYTEPRILTIRGVQVMMDRDIAYQFGTETKFINRCVSRNRERFPIDFVFQLASSEWEDLRFQFGTSRNNHGGRRYLPFAFTEQGVAMLATILKTENAIAASIQINSVLQIFTMRGVQVMLDRDLAALYEVQTKVLNQSVKRNAQRFQKEFMFQMNETEF